MAPPERSGSRTRAAWIEAALRGRRRQAAGLALVPGQVIQGTRYRLLRWIGDGGMGVVYEAEHVDLERRVALKILRHEACHEPAAIQAFRDEARAVGRIGAEQIVDVFDFAELPDGRLMFAMELIEGTPLYRLYEEQLLSMGRVFAILRQLCKGLAAAHAAGIIHRDIKPDNIIVGTRRGRADAVKILDFGIATILAEQHNAESGLAGTPYYLAPEIVSGLTFDARVDIYALGCTAYEMLVGEPPFFHEALDKSLKAHLVEQPRRPSIVTGRDVPPELEEVVLRCLEKIPGDRYPDMASLEAALCRAQLKARIISEWDDLPLPEVDPDERAELLSGYAELAAVRGPTRRSRALLWGVIAGVFGLAIALWFFAAPAADSEELAALEQLADKARTAASRASFVYPLSSDPSAPTAYAIIDDIEALRSSVGRVASRRADALREEFAGTLVGLGDEYWERPGGKGFAVDYYAQALLFEPDNAAANNRVTYTPGQLAVLRDKVERHDFTERDFFIAATLEALAEQNPEVRARKIEALQRDEEQAVSTQETLEELLRGDPAIVRPTKIAQRPKPIKEETQPTKDPTEDPTEDGPPTPPDLPTEEPVSVTDPVISDAPSADALVRDAKAAMNAGRGKEAERLYEKALAADSRSAPALIGLSDVHFNRGDYDKAANYARRAVKLRPKNAAYRMKLGDAYYKVFRYEEAREHYAAAMAQGHPDAERLLKKVESKLGK
ncbi:MAG: protein kinase [Myxococcales bacterium]|nr:protein kinase [Myxococcales bacterium]